MTDKEVADDLESLLPLAERYLPGGAYAKLQNAIAYLRNINIGVSPILPPTPKPLASKPVEHKTPVPKSPTAHKARTHR